MHNLVFFKNKYHKEHGLLMYSGTLAIEAALRIAGISKGDKVLFNNLACYSVLEAVNNIEGTPILMNPTIDQIVLEPFEVIKVIKSEMVKCFIAIHQYGIYQEIELIKKECPDVVIIEDLSQAWNIISPTNNEHRFSDYVVLSLGKTKPLSFGIGGVLLTNNELLFEKTDLRDRNSRYKELPLISYMIPSDFKINMAQVLLTGDNNVNIQRHNASRYKQIFRELKNISVIYEDEEYRYCWHRYPIFIKRDYEHQFITLLEQLDIPYQKEFSISLHQLRMAKNAIYIGKNNSKKLYLLRTRI